MNQRSAISIDAEIGFEKIFAFIITGVNVKNKF